MALVMVRLACVVCSTIALHISHTPPNCNPPPDGVTNTLAPTLWERYFMLWIICVKYLTWAACALHILQFRNCDDSDVPPTLAMVLGTALSMCGASVRLWCFRLLGRRFTFHIATHNSDHSVLITTGPYAVVRHPSYVAGVLCFAGVCLVFLRPHLPWVFVVCAVASPLCARVGQEEVLLRREFGETWDAYCRAVPWRVLPGIL